MRRRGPKAKRTKKKATLARTLDGLPMDRETSDDELAAWGGKHIPGFTGVVARNELRKAWPDNEPLEPGASVVLNLDFGYRTGGTHWTAARVSSEAPLVLYVDSYGMPPPRELVLRARKDGKGIVWSDMVRQGLDEVNCGPRAVATLAWLAREAGAGKEMEAFQKLAGEG